MLSKYEKEKSQVVYICVAGRSNALGGFVDANTSFPVINCPPKSEDFAGFDILSSLRMPSNVAALTVLEPDQAALAAAKILSFTNKKIGQSIKKLKLNLKTEIIKANQN